MLISTNFAFWGETNMNDTSNVTSKIFPKASQVFSLTLTKKF